MYSSKYQEIHKQMNPFEQNNNNPSSVPLEPTISHNHQDEDQDQEQESQEKIQEESNIEVAVEENEDYVKKKKKKKKDNNNKEETSGKALVQQEYDCGRERLKRHRTEVAGRVWIPDIWGQEELLKDWIDCGAFDASLMPNTVMTARAALVQEGRRTTSGGLRI